MTQGVLQPRQFVVLYAPVAAKVSEIHVSHGESVAPRQALLTLDNPDLNVRQAQLSSQLDTVLWQMRRAGVDQRLLERSQVLAADKARIEAELQAIADERERFTSRAPFAGRYVLLEPDLQVNDWISADTPFALVADPSHWQVEAYLTEQDIDRIRVQDSARFYFETPSLVSVPMQIVRIDSDATRNLQNGLLALGRGGNIAVRASSRGEWVPEQAVYRVVLEPSGDYQPESPRVERGRIVIHGAARSYLQRYWRTALSVVVREAGF